MSLVIEAKFQISQNSETRLFRYFFDPKLAGPRLGVLLWLKEQVGKGAARFWCSILQAQSKNEQANLRFREEHPFTLPRDTHSNCHTTIKFSDSNDTCSCLLDNPWDIGFLTTEILVIIKDSFRLPSSQ